MVSALYKGHDLDVNPADQSPLKRAPERNNEASTPIQLLPSTRETPVATTTPAAIPLPSTPTSSSSSTAAVNDPSTRPSKEQEVEKDIEAQQNESDIQYIHSTKAEEEQNAGGDPSIVDFDGPDDPLNARNWSSRRKWGNIAVIAGVTFLTYVLSTTFPVPSLFSTEPLQHQSLFSLMHLSSRFVPDPSLFLAQPTPFLANSHPLPANGPPLLSRPLASSMFAPGVPGLMQEFHSTSTSLASFVVSVYVLGYAFGPIVLAPLSELYGRMPLYHASNVGFVVFTVACALASDLKMLIGFRFVEGVFGSCPITIGGGTIADLFVAETRGKVMALWALGPLMGPVIGPVAGGYLAEAKGWRWVFWVIAMVVSF